MKKWRVTFVRRVVESVTLNVEARTRQDAIVGAAMELKDGDEWERTAEPMCVGKVERVEAPKGDPLDVPAGLKRTA